MGSGGPSKSTQYVKTETSNLPEYAKPFYMDLMGAAKAQTLGNMNEMPVYDQNRIAQFSKQQEQVQQNILGQQTPGQFGAATGLTTAAGLGSLMGSQYTPGQFGAQQIGQPNLQQFSMSAPQQVQGGQYSAPQMGAAQTGFQPNLQQFEMGGARDVAGIGVNAPTMQAAQTGYGQGPLEQFRMEGPQAFGLEQAQQYMSPFIQQALEPQMREAVRSARQGQIVQDLGAARQGTYGGSRQLLAGMERERNLGQQLGDIQARGMETAFGQAQQQFERDRAAGMTTGQQNLQAALQQQQLGVSTGMQAALANLSNEQQAAVNNQAIEFQARGMSADNAMKAALANQGVDVTRGQQNLQSQLQTQQLGTETGLRSALANLDAASQSNVQNLAAQLQTQGLNADQALRAALANQQAGLTVGQQNLQSALSTQQLGTESGLRALLANQQTDLDAQRLGEQSRQFASQQQLAGLGQAGQMGRALGEIGQTQQQADMARLNQQQQTAAQSQALEQQQLDMDYQDFLREQNYPLEMLQQYSSLLRGVPVTPNTTSTTTMPQPSLASQIMGTGIGALGAYKALG